MAVLLGLEQRLVLLDGLANMGMNTTLSVSLEAVLPVSVYISS